MAGDPPYQVLGFPFWDFSPFFLSFTHHILFIYFPSTLFLFFVFSFLFSFISHSLHFSFSFSLGFLTCHFFHVSFAMCSYLLLFFSLPGTFDRKTLIPFFPIFCFVIFSECTHSNFLYDVIIA